MLFPTVKSAVDKLPASCACTFNRENFFHISGLGFDGAALALLFQVFVFSVFLFPDFHIAVGKSYCKDCAALH